MGRGCNSEIVADESADRSLSETEPRLDDGDSGIAGDEGSTGKVVRGGASGLVGLESTMDDVGNAGGVSRGLTSAELVGVTVGTIIGCEGAAFSAAGVCRAGDCSKFVSVCVKLRTGTSTSGGLATVHLQFGAPMVEIN